MEQNSKPPIWFWVASSIFLVWNLLGIGSFISHIMITDEVLQTLPEAERTLYESFPVWFTVAFAVAVFGSSLGCVGLLLRKSWSRMVLIIGFAGIGIQMFYSLFISNSFEVYGPGMVAMPIMIIIVGIFLIWFAGYGIKKGWLR